MFWQYNNCFKYFHAFLQLNLHSNKFYLQNDLKMNSVISSFSTIQREVSINDEIKQEFKKCSKNENNC